MKKYISNGDWFDKGTEAELIADCTMPGSEPWGIFRGIRNGKEDEEGCGYDEFDIVDMEEK